MTQRFTLALFPAMVLAICIGLTSPVEAPITAPFAPTGPYSGHFGVDFAVPSGTPVTTAGEGYVVFAGWVVDNLAVTVDHGGGLITTYSYLRSIAVRKGALIEKGQILGWSGVAHGQPGLHFSVRVGGVYQDPALWLSCRTFDISAGLRLVPLAVA